MHAHGVDVLHGAHGDHVARGVPHDLKLDFLPAGNAALNEHLAHAAQVDAAVGDLPQGVLVVGDAAAGAAQGVGGTDDDGVADLVGEVHRILHGVDHLRGDAGLANGLHAVLKALAVLRLVDGGGAGAQQLHPVLFQGTVLIEGHGQVQAGLAAHVGQQGVGPLLLDDLGHRGDVHGLDIYMVGNILVGHDGCGVGVDQHHLHALFLQGTAGLGAGVVKFSGLADDDGAGAQHQDLLYIGILRHYRAPP